MLKLSNNPAIDTATKLVAVAVLMFAFVFVVMVPLYNVLCDALGINGKTSGQAYTSVQAVSMRADGDHPVCGDQQRGHALGVCAQHHGDESAPGRGE